jgi:hypothetical protein
MPASLPPMVVRLPSGRAFRTSPSTFAPFGNLGQAGQVAHHPEPVEGRDLRLSLSQGGEGTNTSPINMRGIRITIKVVVILESVERVVKEANGLGGYDG